MIKRLGMSVSWKILETKNRGLQLFCVTKVNLNSTFSHFLDVENLNTQKIREVTSFALKPVENYPQPVENFCGNGG